MSTMPPPPFHFSPRSKPAELSRSKPAAPKAPSTVIEHLRVQLANAVTAWWVAKVCHWNVKGRGFRSDHSILDAVAGARYETVDSLAERIRALGEDVDLIELEAAAGAASVKTAKAGQSAEDMLALVLANEQAIAVGMREASSQAEKEGDAGTVDLLGGMIREAEKLAWMLKSTVG